MDVRCDRCQTEYELKDENVPDAGTTVKCTTCGNVFKVSKNATAAATQAPSEWFLGVDGVPVGPLSTSDVQARLATGEVNGETLIWKEGDAEWSELRSVDQFWRNGRPRPPERVLPSIGWDDEPLGDDELDSDTELAEPAGDWANDPLPEEVARIGDRGNRDFAPPAVPESKPSTAHKRRVFVCYRRDDNPYATDSLVNSLVLRFGRDAVFHDVDSIPFGVDFRLYLSSAVRQCSACLVVIGRQWLKIADAEGRRRLDSANDFVRIEIEAALELDVPVIPVLIDGAKMPTFGELPRTIGSLTYRQGTVVRPGPDFAHDVARLARALEAPLGHPSQ